jgi:hypothetical protein
MTAHPFDIKASASANTPDELMITWGNLPNGSVASIYLPAVASAKILALADSMYVRHRLSTIDANTVQFPAGDVTFVPVPKGQGRYAGLLSIDLPQTTHSGDVFTLAVRQLTTMSATIEPPPPPPQNQITREAPGPEVAAPPKTFSWRQVLGAFQYTVTIKPKEELLYPQERLLAWLKWRIGVTPPSNRWLPVLQRYLNLTAGLVLNYGGDPNKIPPSQVGNVPGKHSPGPPPPVPPFPPVKEHEYTGKVVAIHYDRFGDFCGFVILTEAGHEHRFLGREHAIEQLVREAWIQRTVVSVRVEGDHHDWPTALTLRRYH